MKIKTLKRPQFTRNSPVADVWLDHGALLIVLKFLHLGYGSPKHFNKIKYLGTSSQISPQTFTLN